MSQKLLTFQHALNILTFNPGTQEADASIPLSVQGQPGLYRKFQYN